MKKLLFIALMLSGATTSFAQQPDTRLYEMRTYWPAAGKMDNMLARFRNHATKLFVKHGITNIGYWVPQRKPDSVLVYILAYPNKEARDASWKAFSADPEWQKVKAESEVNGKVVEKVEQRFLSSTDFSPNDLSSKDNRVFELRTYKATKYNLGLLLARFRNHTVGLFAKHGMSNLIYWTQNDKDDMLIYLLGHKSKEAAAASFNAFRTDADWITARTASETLAKSSLTVSLLTDYLIPTDFSPLK
ncbi:MAG: NIPSNAP family protein [Runella slithyformis]|nr:MAG: NIPSNAP family protein [Runella slithyformis]